MPRLESTLDLLQRHHRANGIASRRGGSPSSGSWHALWPQLSEIRAASVAGDSACRDWLALNHNLVHVVEKCREIQLRESLTFQPSR